MTARMVIVGDTLLDRDVDGAVARLCPDAPVPVLDERGVVERPGGAGLAALLANRYGGEVVLVTALADDAGGARLAELLDGGLGGTGGGVEVHPLTLVGGTPEKIRLRTGDQTLLRIDRGGDAGGQGVDGGGRGEGGARCGEPSEATLAALRNATVILVSDYGRGVLRQPAVRSALASASAPIVWDPHPRGPAPVSNVRLATPNEAEVRQLAGGGRGDRLATANRGAQALRQRWRAGAVAVTMAELGALLCHTGPAPLVVPAPTRASGDSCGAGDSFAVSAAAAIGAGAPVTEAVRTAVSDATWFVANGGIHAARSDPPPPAPAGSGVDAVAAAAELVARVRANGGRVVATGGCFDVLHAGHVATLQAARQLGDCLVVCLNSDASVAGLKGPGRPVNTQAERSRMLAALRYVDAVVIFDEPTPHGVLSWLRPDVWVKGGDYDGSAAAAGLPEAELLQRWNGQAVVVPYLGGHSTTALVAAGNGHPTKGRRW